MESATSQVRKGQGAGLAGQAEMDGEGLPSDLRDGGRAASGLALRRQGQVIGQSDGGASHTCILAYAQPPSGVVQQVLRPHRDREADVTTAAGVDDGGYGHQPPLPPLPSPPSGGGPAPVAARQSGNVARDLAAWAVGELPATQLRSLGLAGAGAAQAMTESQSVWTREELLDTVVPLALVRHLDAAGIAQVVREVEDRAVRLADRVSPGIVRGGLPGPVWTTQEMLRVERAIVAHVAELAAPRGSRCRRRRSSAPSRRRGRGGRGAGRSTPSKRRPSERCALPPGSRP